MDIRRTITALTLVSVSWCLTAQETDTLSAASVFGVKVRPVVPAAEQVYLPLQSAAPQQMAAVLQHFTGVQVKDYGGTGGLKTINVRSLGSEHVGVFLDGIQIDNAQNMQVDLGRFSTDGIGTVELYNGQKSRRLQTAKEYASGAAVHLTSESTLLFSDSGGRFRLRGGSFGTVNPSLLWDKHLGDRITLRTQAEFLTSNGKYKYPCFDTTLVRENGDIKSLRLEAQLFGTLSDGRWNMHVYAYGSERGFPGPVIRRAMGFPFSAERQADQDMFIQGGWDQDWTDRYSTSVKFKYSNNYTHYDTHPEKNPMAMPYDLHYRQNAGYASLAQSYILADPWSVDFSSDLQYNTLDSDVGQNVTPRRATYIGALATRVAWETFRAAAHLVYMGAWDWFETPNAGGWTREDTYRDAWMPSLSLFWRPVSYLEFDAYAKRSYRLPSFNDLYYSQMGNSSLVPELAEQYGLDIRFSGRKPANCHWNVRVSPYFNRISNKIVAIPTSSQFRWTMLNIGLVDVTGLDTKAEFGVNRGEWSMEGTLRYSLQQALDHSDSDSRTYGNQIPYIPLHSGGFGLEARYGYWSLCWDTSISGGKWSRTANIPDYYIEPWSISDASVSRLYYLTELEHRGLVPELNVTLNLGNVFNRPYQIVQGYPMPGFNALLSMEIKW
ncbi:MAG: TonB-dependent receptor [Bacteroidales bacterium]|nr:TonB-dependent receptor [Bacteroidales bacterium]